MSVKNVANGSPPPTVLTIQINEDQVRAMAYEISLQPKTWDELIWFFAQSELRLTPAYAIDDCKSTGTEMCASFLYTKKSIKIYPGKVVDRPGENDIRILAEQVARQGPRLQELHWYIAERNYIYDVAKSRK